MINDAGIEVESSYLLDEIVNVIVQQDTKEEEKKEGAIKAGTSQEDNEGEKKEDDVREPVRPAARLQETPAVPGAERQEEEDRLQLAPGAGPQEDGRLLRILSTINPWYRIPRHKQEEGKEQTTPGGDLQEVVLEEESRVPEARCQGAGQEQGVIFQGARPKGSFSNVVAEPVLEARVKGGSLQGDAGCVQEDNQANKTQKNLDLFERSIQNRTKALNAYDDKPEIRASYKIMYEEQFNENQRLNEIIKHGRLANSQMQAKLVQYEKAFQACDTDTTEKLLETNIGLKNETDVLHERLNKQKEEISNLKDVVKELTEPGANIPAVLQDEDTEIPEDDTEASEEDNVAELLRMKKSGHDRINPQVLAQPKSTEAVNSEFKCGVCNLVRDSKAKLERHIQNHKDEGDWTCDGCSYQSNEQSDLLNHLLEKRDHSANLLNHMLNENVYERREKCNICGELFENKANLHGHLLDRHKTYKPCNKMPECSGEGCRYNHDEVRHGAIICYQCGDDFNSNPELMNHMKNKHVMPVCKHFNNGRCTFYGRCWYSHKVNSNLPTTQASVSNKRPKSPAAPVFWGPPQNKAPPTQETMNQQQLLDRVMRMNQEMMTNMMTQMNQNMMSMMQQMNHLKQ